MGRESFEQLLGFHAAPTFMGVKAASLLSFQKSKFEDFDALLASYESCFRCKGISVYRVAEGEEYVLILFYRGSALSKLLHTEGARKLLVECGYDVNDTLEGKLEFLKTRMQVKKSFPHEVGLFLGYPPDDVRGFIENRGQGFSYSGYWKVYANEEETRELFELYSSCTHDFCQKLENGTAFAELLQAV